MIGLKNEDAAMFVLNDRAQGGTSSKPGRLELNILRKTVGSDMGGMVQGPDFKGELHVEFYLHFETRKTPKELPHISEIFSKLLRKSS